MGTYSNSFTPELYLKHKQYFDERLIQQLENDQSKLSVLKSQLETCRLVNKKDKSIIRALESKNKDLEIICANLKQKIQDKNEKAEDMIKDFEKQIEDLDKSIHGELQIAYKTNTELHDENARLKKEIEKLRRENKKYKSSSKKDSSNSSIPSSKDENKKVTSSRTPSDLKKGGQPGHKVHRSKFNQVPDKVIYKYTAKAPQGAIAVFNDQKEIQYYVTQEINAFFKTGVTETRYVISDKAPLLPEKEMKKYLINSVTYHDDLKSMVLYLNNKGTIALQRLCTMLNEMSEGKLDIKPSTVVKWSREFQKKGTSYMASILEALLKDGVLHVDETGWKINGKQKWLHVIASERYAYFMVTEKRGNKEEGPLKLLKEYEGCVVHDHYIPYYTRLLKCEHAECNAHILRYLKAGMDLDKNEACGEMHKLMQKMIHRKKELMRQGIMKMEEEEINKYEKQYHQILNEELEKYQKAHPKRKKGVYVPEYIKLMRRMEKYSEEHLRFIKNFRIPADNNLAERQMRPTKAKKKISGQSQNIETANNFACIHSVIQTCTLQKKNTLEEIKAIFKS